MESSPSFSIRDTGNIKSAVELALEVFDVFHSPRMLTAGRVVTSVPCQNHHARKEEVLKHRLNLAGRPDCSCAAVIDYAVTR